MRSSSRPTRRSSILLAAGVLALATTPPTGTPGTSEVPSPAATAPATATVDTEAVPATTPAPPDDGEEAAPRVERSALDDLSDDEVRRVAATISACGADAGWVCSRLVEWTGNEALAETMQWVADVPVRIALIVVVALVVNRFVRLAIGRHLRRVNDRAVAAREDDPGKPLRSALRMATASSTIASAATVVIAVVAAFAILGELGVSLGPLLAGAGVAGIAIGFGAQHLVRDVLAGLFVLIEDQYGVGDVIDFGRAGGTVEEFTLRVTKVRDLDGTLWFVPNGEIAEVGNKSQLWSRAVVDVGIAYGADHDRAGQVIKEAADRVWHERRPGARIIEEPELWGVEQFGDSEVLIRLAVKSAPAEQWAVARAVRGEIKRALDDAGIEIPFPQQAIWVRRDGDGELAGALGGRNDG